MPIGVTSPSTAGWSDASHPSGPSPSIPAATPSNTSEIDWVVNDHANATSAASTPAAARWGSAARTASTWVA